jgi:hypothetical protein
LVLFDNNKFKKELAEAVQRQLVEEAKKSSWWRDRTDEDDDSDGGGRKRNFLVNTPQHCRENNADFPNSYIC